MSATLQEVKDYLATVGVPTGKYSDSVLTTALDVEEALQLRRCKAPSELTGDDVTVLNQALCRRVYLNVARRPYPLGGVPESASDGQTTSFFMTADQELRRMEAPFRKMVVG